MDFKCVYDMVALKSDSKEKEEEPNDHDFSLYTLERAKENNARAEAKTKKTRPSFEVSPRDNAFRNGKKISPTMKFAIPFQE